MTPIKLGFMRCASPPTQYFIYKLTSSKLGYRTLGMGYISEVWENEAHFFRWLNSNSLFVYTPDEEFEGNV